MASESRRGAVRCSRTPKLLVSEQILYQRKHMAGENVWIEEVT